MSGRTGVNGLRGSRPRPYRGSPLPSSCQRFSCPEDAANEVAIHYPDGTVYPVRLCSAHSTEELARTWLRHDVMPLSGRSEA